LDPRGVRPLAVVIIRTRQIIVERVIDLEAIDAHARLDGVVAPDLAEVVHPVIGVLNAGLRTVRTEPNGEKSGNVDYRDGGTRGSLGSNAAEPIARGINGIYRIHRTEIEARIADAQFIQSCGRKGVRPRDGILLSVRRVLLREAGNSRANKWDRLDVGRGLVQAIKPDRVAFANLVVDSVDILAAGRGFNRIVNVIVTGIRQRHKLVHQLKSQWVPINWVSAPIHQRNHARAEQI